MPYEYYAESLVLPKPDDYGVLIRWILELRRVFFIRMIFFGCDKIACLDITHLPYSSEVHANLVYQNEQVFLRG